MNQPWYHENMTRDQAMALLNSLPEKDGYVINLVSFIIITIRVSRPLTNTTKIGELTVTLV